METDISGPLLKRWEIAVVAVNVVIVISLLVIIPLVMACVCTTVWQKRYTKEQRRRARGRMAASYMKRKRPKSMAEHLQLEESDVETVDFGELTQQLAPVHLFVFKTTPRYIIDGLPFFLMSYSHSQ